MVRIQNLRYTWWSRTRWNMSWLMVHWVNMNTGHEMSGENTSVCDLTYSHDSFECSWVRSVVPSMIFWWSISASTGRHFLADFKHLNRSKDHKWNIKNIPNYQDPVSRCSMGNIKMVLTRDETIAQTRNVAGDVWDMMNEWNGTVG